MAKSNDQPKRSEADLVRLILSASAGDQESIREAIAGLEAEREVIEKKIDALKTLDRSIDRKINGKPPRKKPGPRKPKPAQETPAAPAPPVPQNNMTQLASRIFEHVAANGAAPMKKIAARLQCTEAQIRVAVAGCEQLDTLDNGTIFMA